MATNDRTDRSRAVGHVSCCSFVVAGAILLLIYLLGAWLYRGWRGEDWAKDVSSDVLADYVPEDSEAVLAVNVRQLLAAPIGRPQVEPFLQKIIDQAGRELSWLGMIGINSIDDIDTLLISFAPGSGAEPLLLVRGRFDRSRFQIGPDKLQEKTLDRFRVWEHRDRFAKQTTLLTIVGDTLLVSETPSRVQAALKQGRDPQPIRVRDATLRDLLAKVDRRQSLWLAASLRSLGPITGIDTYLLKMVLRPLLAHADSVYGGIAFAEDVQAELHLSAPTEEAAAQLETDLKCLCEAAPGAALLSRQSEWLPLLRLLGAGQVHRDGKTILLRCKNGVSSFFEQKKH